MNDILEVSTRYKDVNFGFIKLNLRSPGQFLCGEEWWDFKLKSIKTQNAKNNEQFLSCRFKKDFFNKSYSGVICFLNGSKIEFKNNSRTGYKQINVEFYEGVNWQINLGGFRGGIIYEDEICSVSMPEFSRHFNEGREVEKVSISSAISIRLEIKALAILIYSHYFDYQFESSIG